MNISPLLNSVSARELQRDYKSVFARAKKLNEPVMVISNNQPQGIILSPDTFKRYSESLERQLLWETISSIQKDNLNTNEQEIEEDVNQAIKRARMKPYGKASSNSR